MKKCNAPTLVMATEKDGLFPGKGVIERAKSIDPSGVLGIVIPRIWIVRIRFELNRDKNGIEKP
ncbi:MAG: hypothetical protein K6G45_10175 [Lachnospiraceae bacterium]|nr:hypothetical protein [Lachnospiraceae bacterium]